MPLTFPVHHSRPRALVDIRASATRWRELRRLLRQLQHLAQATLAIDLAGSASAGAKVADAATFEADLSVIEDAIHAEVTRVTVEALHVELLVRMKQDRQ